MDETENGAVLEHAVGTKTPAANTTTCPKEETATREGLVHCFGETPINFPAQPARLEAN